MLAGNSASHLKRLQHNFAMANVTIFASLPLLSFEDKWEAFPWHVSFLQLRQGDPHMLTSEFKWRKDVLTV